MGATTIIVNMLVFFFNGFATGASVVIGRYFGARDMEQLHKSVEDDYGGHLPAESVLQTVGPRRSGSGT